MRSPSLEPDAPVVRMFRHTDNLLRGDAKVRGQLAAAGWRVLEVWECQLKGPGRLQPGEVLAQCRQFLESELGYASIGAAATVTTVV